MKNISTPKPSPLSTRKTSPTVSTLAFIRAFARAYAAPVKTIQDLPGVILN